MPATRTKDWLQKAAFIWVDMERGVYDWGERKQPKHLDGRYRVIYQRVLTDCGLSPQYGEHDWYKDPEFQRLLELERARRDHAITDLVVSKVEEATGPLLQARNVMHENVQAIFSRPPDSDDPQALSPDQYQKGALAWTRYIDEQLGRGESQKEHGLDAVFSHLVQERKVTSTMMDGALSLLAEYRAMQDQRLRQAGFIEGELEED